MKKLDIYIIKKFLGTFFYAITLIVLITIVFDISEKIDDFIEKQAPIKAIVFDYYLNFIPYWIILFSSLFTFISVIFFTSKMTNNFEIVAILSSGVSFKRMLVPYFVGAFIIAVFSFLLASYLIPHANKTRLEFENTYIKNPYINYDRNIHKQIEPGVYVYMESYNNFNEIGYKFSIEKFENGKLVSKLISDYIKWDSTINKWQINNYYIRRFDRINETLEKGKTIDTTLNIHPSDFTRRLNIVETMDLNELNNFIEEQKLQGSENIETYLIEKYKRIANPFATFILTLIGATLAARKTKGGIGAHIGLGILIAFSYILFMQFSTTFAIEGNMNTLLAVWIPNILYSFIGIFLYKMSPK